MRQGDSKDAEILNTFTDETDDVVTSGDDMRSFDSVGAQLITEDAEEEIAVETGDSADQATDTLAFAGFDFTGLEGATIRVEGAAEAGNNGDHIITTGADGSAVCAASTFTDETFDPDTVTATLIHTEDPLLGDWFVEVSNNFVPASNGTVYGQVSNAGTWTDITSEFTPSIATVTAAGSQYAQADLTARAIRYGFTPTGGQGTLIVRRFKKSWS
jgi:hypothetical protein